MSILIDWDMPIACRDCHLQYSGWCHYRIFEERRIEDENLVIERPDWCQLIEVPASHGDLVDREKLIAEYDRQHVGPPGGARKIMVEAKAVIKGEA